jgi:DNA repair ATPase RecN
MPAAKKPVKSKAIDHVTELVREVEDLRLRATDEGLQRRAKALDEAEKTLRTFTRKLSDVCDQLQVDSDELAFALQQFEHAQPSTLFSECP